MRNDLASGVADSRGSNGVYPVVSKWFPVILASWYSCPPGIPSHTASGLALWIQYREDEARS